MTSGTELSEAQIEEYRDAFKLFDADGDGTISVQELETVMKSLGLQASQQELQQMMTEADEDGSGSIEFEEFLNMMKKKMKENENSIEDVKAAFKVFDQNGDGFISSQELKNVMMTLGEVLSEEEIQEMIREADADGDGKVCFVEFASMLSHKTATKLPPPGLEEN